MPSCCVAQARGVPASLANGVGFAGQTPVAGEIAEVVLVRSGSGTAASTSPKARGLHHHRLRRHHCSRIHFLTTTPSPPRLLPVPPGQPGRAPFTGALSDTCVRDEGPEPCQCRRPPPIRSGPPGLAAAPAHRPPTLQSQR
jgi:hypothetical protein